MHFGADKKLAWMAAGLLAWCALLVLIALASLQPPSPRPVTDPPKWFSADRALVSVRALASQPHPIGTPAHVLTQDYLVTQLHHMGFAPHVQTVPVVCSRVSRPYRAATVSNVWVRLSGRESTGTVLIASHYDSVPTGPGASDDAASASAMLETLRALQSEYGSVPTLRNDMIFLWTDAEEAGLMGARAFVSQSSAPPGSPSYVTLNKPVIALNFEARGVGGPSLMFETSPQNGWLVREFLRAVPNPAASSLFYAVYKILPNDTDFTEFRASGMRGLNFAYIDKVSHYHTRLDSVEHLDRRSLQHQGDNMLALARHFGDMPLASKSTATSISISASTSRTTLSPDDSFDDAISAPDVIYFNYARSAVLCYPESWAVPLALLATLLTVCFLMLGLRSGYFTLASVAINSLAIPVVVAGVGSGTLLLVRFLAALAPAPRSVLYLGSELLAGVILLAMAITWGFFGWVSQHIKENCSKEDKKSNKGLSGQSAEAKLLDPEGMTAGAALWWLLLTWLTTWKLPGGSYLFVWPLLIIIVVNLMISWGCHVTAQGTLASVQPRQPSDQLSQSTQRQGTSSQFYLYYAGLLICVVPIILLVLPTQCLLFATLSAASFPIIAALTVLIVALAFPHFTLLTRLVPSRSKTANSLLSRLHFLILPPLLLMSGLILVGHGATVMRPTPEHPQSDSIFYGLNADTGRALWASGDDKADVWTTQFIGDNPSRSGLPDFIPASAGTFLQAAAPNMPLPPPAVTLLTSHTEQGICTVRIQVTSPRHAPMIEIAAPDADVVDATVEDQLARGNIGLNHAWSLFYLNVPKEGLTISLRVKLKYSDSKQAKAGQSKDALLLRVIDRSYGLPSIPDKAYAPRPRSFIAAPTNNWCQDSALVSKSFLLSIRR